MSCKIPLWAANIEVGGMRMKRNAICFDWRHLWHTLVMILCKTLQCKAFIK